MHDPSHPVGCNFVVLHAGTYEVSYWLSGTSPYCVVYNNNGSFSEYAYTCRAGGRWERTETSLLGCGGTTLPNTTEEPSELMIGSLQGACVKSTGSDQYLKAQGALGNACPPSCCNLPPKWALMKQAAV
eukprot:5145088-Amphidinium_carterae.1